jgi:uncharacterized protein (DUF1800 family)
MAPLGERAATRRLLERFGFGPRPGELDTATGFDATLTAVMSTVDKDVAVPELRQESKDARQQLREDQNTLILWWLDRMVSSEATFVERITWFWHGHFATSVQKVRSPRLMLAQNQTLRRLALGDFAELATAMVADPALLIWLDGQKNTAKAATENLARELMELFTLGVGEYSEQDVREAARALTGWKVNREAMTATVTPRQHDTGPKTVLGHTGELDAAGLVDILVTQPVSARFVARRLWFRLVSITPPADDVLARLTSAYGPKRDIRALLRAIATEPAFRDEGSTMVKQPVEWAVGLMRALRMTPSALPAADRTKLLAGLRGMGQLPFLPPSVGGWPAGAAWLTTAAGLARLQVARLITAHASSLPRSAAAMAQLLGVDAWSDRTGAALDPIKDQPAQLAAVAATAPEYVVSG